MDIGVEVSLYPLDREFVPPIQAFIDRLNAHGGLKVVTNSMSTQLFGPYEQVMHALTREIRATMDSNDKAVFVVKVLGPLAGA